MELFQKLRSLGSGRCFPSGKSALYQPLGVSIILIRAKIVFLSLDTLENYPNAFSVLSVSSVVKDLLPRCLRAA